MKDETYRPETPEEELMKLAGRVEALIGYVRRDKYSIDREVIAAILGFELNPGEGDIQR